MSWLSAVGAWIGAYAGTISTVVQTVGTVASAYASWRAGEQQAAAAKFNAELALGQAFTERAKHQLEEKRHRERTRRLLARQKSLYLKAGVTMEGTPLDVITETATEAERDAILIQASGAGAYLEGIASKAMWSQYGKGAREAGYLRAGTTLLTGAGRGLAAYGGMQRTQQTIPGGD